MKSSLWALAVLNGGVYGKMYLVSHWHVLISSYYLTVSNLLSLTALKSEEFILSSGSFKWGVYGKMYLVSHWHVLISSYYLTVSNGTLIDCIEKWRVHSELWQFWMGGVIVRCTWCHTDISLYLPIIWLFWVGSHWLHWKVKSSLWALAVSNGGVNCQIYPKSENLSSFQVFLISSYYLTVLNGLSLTTLKSKEFTLSSGSFEWGVNHQIYPKSENLSSFQVFLISSYYLTVSNGCSLVPLKSIELTQCSGSFEWGGFIRFTLNLKIWAHFPYIFLLFDCFEWMLIGNIEKHRVHSALWQFWMGGVHQIYPKSENLSSLAISCFASQNVFLYYIRKT